MTHLQEFEIHPSPAENTVPAQNWPNHGLVSRILESVAALKDEGPTGAWINREFPQKMMLTLLAFSYANGLLRSEEIEERSASDPTLRYISGAKGPPVTLIRSFRRGHRVQLEKILGDIFGVDRGGSILNAAIMLDSVGSAI